MTAQAREVLAAPHLARQVHVGRQPIYDRAREIVAYELLFRDHADAETATDSSDLATTKVIVNTFTEFGLDNLVGDRLAFVNVTRPFLVGDLPIPLPPKAVVLEVLETVEPDDEVVAGVARLVAEGYRIALDDFVWRSGAEGLVRLASYIKLDVLAMDHPTLDATVARCRESQAELVAERVEDEATLTRVSELGFELFQGYYLGRPQVVSAPSLSPTLAKRIELLGRLSHPDITLDEVMDVVRLDPALSYRTLHAANAASTGLRRRVTSVRDAMMLLGLNRLRSWLVLMVVADASSATDEQLSATMTRARACELLAEEQQASHAEAGFTVGLLSGVAELLGVEVATVLERLPLDEEPRAALLSGSGTLGEVLRAVRAQEADDFGALAETNIPLFDVSRAYLSAVGWSLQVCRSVLGNGS